MRSVRITHRPNTRAATAIRQPTRPSTHPSERQHIDLTWHHPDLRLPLIEPTTALPQPRQGSPSPDPRPPTEHRRPRWSADTR
jgi:hypothetical protein